MVKYCLNIFAITVLLVLNSCSKEKSLIKERTVLQISPAMTNHTKSLVDDTNISAKEIGFQITNELGTQLYDGNAQYTNLRLTKPGALWFIDEGTGTATDVIVKGNNAKIYAYYPFTANTSTFTGTGESSVLMADIPQQHSKGYVADYLWSAQNRTLPTGGDPINVNSAVVQLKMNHALSLIAFVFYKSGYENPGNISRVEMKSVAGNTVFRVNKDGINDLRMKLSNGEIVGGTMVSSLVVSDIDANITLTSDPGTTPSTLFSLRNFHMLLVPASIASRDDIEFDFEIDGNTYIAKFPGVGPLNMIAGNLYILTVKLSPKALNITGVATWNMLDYEVSSGYDDLWYGMQPVQIGSLLWAPVNVGYDPVSNPYGLMFQWHRKYGQIYGTTNLINSKVSLDTGSDIVNKNKFYTNTVPPFDWCSEYKGLWDMSDNYNPCPSGWRIPTQQEMLLLIASGETWVNVGEGGINNLPGRWFGGNHSTDRTNSVFLPSCGVISTSGSSGNRFPLMHGHYSTSTGYIDYFYRLIITPTYSDVSTISKSVGISVRCVKDL